MKSTKFIYDRVSRIISHHLPAASLEYSDAFWNDFEPYFYENINNVQAFAGELVYTENEYIKCVFKVSQSEDYSILNEYKILRKAAEVLGLTFPHMCKPLGIVKYKSHISIDKGFHIEGDSSPSVHRDMLLIEYVPHISDFEKFVQRETRKEILLSLFKQVLMCIRIFRHVRLTHYDLHTHNILVRACPPELVFRYDIDGSTIHIPSFGYMIVIIDFGYSHIDDEKSFLYSSLRCVEYGLLTDRFMPYSDYIRFLYHFSYDVRKSSNPAKHILRKKALAVFRNYSDRIIKKNGLEKSSLIDIIDLFEDKTRKYDLILFQSLDWIEQFQSLIEIPICCPARITNDNCLDSFCKEWSKLEERITNASTVSYLFKYLVSSIKIYSPCEHSVDMIKSVFLDEFSRIIQAFLPPIDYAHLISSVHDVAEWMQLLLYKHLQARQDEMKCLYGVLPFNTNNCDEYIWNRFDKLQHKDSDSMFIFQI